VCFLDSADFHEFNQSLPHDPDEPGEPIPTDIDEVMIHITMDIKVTKVGTIRDCGKESAIVYFQGKSTIREPDWVPNAGEDSGIRGKLCSKFDTRCILRHKQATSGLLRREMCAGRPFRSSKGKCIYTLRVVVTASLMRQ
jgi:hypothetical protein